MQRLFERHRDAEAARDYYVQLHNGPYPLGVVRGQLGD